MPALLQKAGGHDPAVATVFEALHCLRIAVTIFDPQERLVFCNEHYRHLFRSSPPVPAMIGRSYEELLRIALDNAEFAGAQAIADPGSLIEECLAQLRDGDFRPVDIRLSDGRTVEIRSRRTPAGGWIVLWADATEARNLRARLEDTVGLSVDAFALWDQADRLIMCNQNFAELNGGESPEALYGLSFLTVARMGLAKGSFAADTPEDLWLENRVAAHRSLAGAMTLKTKTGNAFLLRGRVTRDGGRVSVLTDVTDHIRIQHALKEQARALDHARFALADKESETERQATYLADLAARLDEAQAEADVAKSVVLRTMSHELKTPLNAILGFADLLRVRGAELDGERIAEYAGLIHDGGTNLLRLINQILDLTKLAAGRYEIHRKVLDAREPARAAIERYGEAAAGRGLALTADMPDEAAEVFADRAALAAIIGHLLDNAVKFTPAGGEVRVRVTREKAAVSIAVSDNGPGVARGDLARMLEPFEQAKRAGGEKHEGAGLGLPLARGLAELHGGTLTLDGDTDRGLTATVRLAAS